MGKNYFFDTNILLCLQGQIFEYDFFISSITLQELENIKNSIKYTDDIKYRARKILHLLDENKDKYNVIFYTTDMETLINERHVEIIPDTKIIACCAMAQRLLLQDKNLTFATNDISCKMIANKIFGLDVESILVKNLDEYTVYKGVTLSDEEMSYFYLHSNENIFECLMNEYLIIRKSDGEVVDTLRWNGTEFKKVCNKTVKSTMFGDKIKPKDVYQSCVIDSIYNNTMTAISGKAGSGKSLLSLVTIMNLIETGKYDRVVIMYNPTKARGAVDMGYYSGSAIEKGMQNSIGSILTTKFGDRFAVDMLIQQDKIRLISMADVRGMEVRDNEILYISEAQNTSIELLKLCLSRASSECKIIIEGDYDSQVDSYLFDGTSNGMKRAIEVLKGEEEFGYVHLPNIWRSKIAALVDKL